MFSRKLLALQHHDPMSFDPNNEQSFRQLIVWLEDQRIRHHKIEDRSYLRDANAVNWPEQFQRYIQSLGCPFNCEDRNSVLEWLLGTAINFSYSDSVDSLQNINAASFQESLDANKKSITNPFAEWDFTSDEIKRATLELSQLLVIPPHHDHREVLKACCALVAERLNSRAIEKCLSDADGSVPKMPLDDVPLGFEVPDFMTNQAAKVLRLLHLRHLRELQTLVDVALVKVQTVTANPKTDQKLGKVGF